MEKNMKKEKIKIAIESILQYAWMWGSPRGMDWDTIREYYKEELNDGKEFEPDKTRKATNSHGKY
tara:strand:+ start:419 stop:613 length:195 start_codon:yes stop_codon:yes gene_type:complete